MTFVASEFDAIALATVLPVSFAKFGIAATHRDTLDVAREVRIIPDESIEALGEYGERVGTVYTIEVYASDGTAIGDTWTTADGTVWRADALIADDGLTQRFRVLRLEDNE